jgi:orotidine-5'-phosphate decarboxylase
LGASIAYARAAGLVSIADGKRGDVPHTAAAYAQALTGSTPTPWGEVPGLGADAMTVNPLLGRDALEPIVAGAREAGAGTFVLVRTSNPGAAEIQDDGIEPMRARLARIVAQLGEAGTGECGLWDVGAVVAATEPQLLGELRHAMPHAILLLPGVGAQGGELSALEPAFAAVRASALVTAARSLVCDAVAADDVGLARAVAEELRDATWKLSAAR